MITAWFINTTAGLLTVLLQALPDIPVPAWLTSASGWLPTIFEYGGSMSVWMNMPLVMTVGSVIFGCYIAGAALKFARIVLSLLTLGGGSAA